MKGISLFILISGFPVAITFALLGDEQQGGSFLMWFSLFLAVSVFFLKLNHSESFSPIKIISLTYIVFLLIGASIFEQLRLAGFSGKSEQMIYVGFIGLLLGMIIPTFFSPSSPSNKKFHAPCMARPILLFLLGVSAACYLILIALSGIPLLSDNVDQARINFFAGKGHIAIFYRGAPALSLALLIDALSRNRLKFIILSHFVAFFIVISLLAIGGRGLTLSFLMSYILLHLFMRGKDIKFLIVLFGAIFALGFMSTIGSIRRFGSATVTGALEELIIILTARPAANQLILNEFESGDKFGITAYFVNIASLLPGVSVNTNLELRNIIFLNAENMPETAGINPSISGEAFINFGHWGVFFVPAIFGLVNMMLYIKAKKSEGFFWLAFYFLTLGSSVIAVTSGIGVRMPDVVVSLLWLGIIGSFYNKKLFNF